MIRKSAFLAFFFYILFTGVSCSALPEEGNHKLIFFYSVGCHECMDVKNEFLPNLLRKYEGRITLDSRDIADIENYKFLLGLEKQYGISQAVKVPIIFFAGNRLSGKTGIMRDLDRLLREKASATPPAGQEGRSSFDLAKHFLSFTPLAVASAGLIDGINPCAFTVIIFFISFLALQGYKKRELIVTGIFYILAVFITYLLIGLGFFGFFYSLKGFWLISRIFNLSIGVLSIILGIAAVYDFVIYKKTENTEGLILQLPGAVKNQIRSVIGLHYRKSQGPESKGSKIPVFKLITVALITGFLVSILEALCTGQVYLPTITFVLKTTSIRLRAVFYLVLYNLMFVIPLFIIFVLALLGVSSEEFTRFFKKHFLATKFLLAVVFITLGILLIWRG
jgi:hypothetical protein